MEVTVCDRCGKRLDPALGGKGYLDCDTAFRSRAYDLCGRCACELADEIEGHPNDWELKVEEARRGPRPCAATCVARR